jgi:hypothetical protein
MSFSLKYGDEKRRTRRLLYEISQPLQTQSKVATPETGLSPQIELYHL